MIWLTHENECLAQTLQTLQTEGKPTHLDDGHAAAEHHDDAHLKHHPEGVSDAVCPELVERLCAVAALQSVQGFTFQHFIAHYRCRQYCDARYRSQEDISDALLGSSQAAY